MKNNTFRRLLAMAAAGAMLTSIAACGSSSNDDTASNGSDSTSLISVNNSEPQNGLIPSDTNEMGGGRVIRYLFEGLVSFDAKGKQHLEVAESITPNEDATKYTIKLKKGWKFTNGEAVTAHSFADTWSFAANVKNAQKTASRFSTIKGYDELQDPNVDPKATLSGLSTPDDYTLVVELNKPDSVFPTKLAHQSMFPLPSVAFKDIKVRPGSDWQWSVQVQVLSHDKNIIVVPNKDYKGSRKVSNKGIEYRVYTNEDSAYSDVLVQGNLDVMDQIPQSAVKTFRQDSSVIAYSQAGSSFQSFVIPERLEHFGNDEEGQLCRQAISMAIDRDQIVKKVYNNTKTPTTDFTSPLVPEYVKKLEQNGSNLKYNASKAKEL
ncbi:MAG: ABC transporter substrate-binding protein [Bifidobacterium pseudocatenulatum]